MNSPNPSFDPYHLDPGPECSAKDRAIRTAELSDRCVFHKNDAYRVTDAYPGEGWEQVWPAPRPLATIVDELAEAFDCLWDDNYENTDDTEKLRWQQINANLTELKRRLA